MAPSSHIPSCNQLIFIYCLLSSDLQGQVKNSRHSCKPDAASLNFALIQHSERMPIDWQGNYHCTLLSGQRNRNGLWVPQWGSQKYHWPQPISLVLSQGSVLGETCYLFFSSLVRGSSPSLEGRWDDLAKCPAEVSAFSVMKTPLS